MATIITPGVEQISVKTDKPAGRDDIGGLMIWISLTDGFTPGPTTLAYKGPDFMQVLNKLADGTALLAGATYYIKLTHWSIIDDGADYDLSPQYSAIPLKPTVAAEDITGKAIRGKSVFAGSLGTRGTNIIGSVLAGATTVPVGNTDDFPASGTAVVFSAVSASDRDIFTYTGKTADSFTGCSGVLAHSDGEVVIPLTQTMVIDDNVNEMRFYGDNGSGTIEDLATIGVIPDGGDQILMRLGRGVFNGYLILASSSHPFAASIRASNSAGPALDGNGGSVGVRGRAANGGYGAHGSVNWTSGIGVFGECAGVFGGSSTAFGLYGHSQYGYSMGLETGYAQPYRGHIRFVPITDTTNLVGQRGDVYADNDGLSFFTNQWRKLLKAADEILAAFGTALAPGLTFNADPDTGIFRKAANVLGFTTGGTEAGDIDAAGNWNFVGRVQMNGGATESTTFANATSGDTVAIAATQRRYFNTQAGTKAALTLRLPASPVNEQVVSIGTDGAITALTVQDSAGVGANVKNAPTTLAAGGSCDFVYRSSNSTWYRCR